MSGLPCPSDFLPDDDENDNVMPCDHFLGTCELLWGYHESGSPEIEYIRFPGGALLAMEEFSEEVQAELQDYLERKVSAAESAALLNDLDESGR